MALALETWATDMAWVEALEMDLVVDVGEAAVVAANGDNLALDVAAQTAVVVLAVLMPVVVVDVAAAPTLISLSHLVLV